MDVHGFENDLEIAKNETKIVRAYHEMRSTPMECEIVWSKHLRRRRHVSIETEDVFCRNMPHGSSVITNWITNSMHSSSTGRCSQLVFALVYDVRQVCRNHDKQGKPKHCHLATPPLDQS